MKLRCLLLTLLSAVLLPLALPNDIYEFGNPLIGLLCLAPYFTALTMVPSFRFASLLGVLFGGISTFLAHYWLMFYEEYSFWTISGVMLGYMGFHALLGPILFGLTRVRRNARVFLLAAAWGLYEYLKSSGFLAFPWGLISHPFGSVLPLIQFVDFTGLWGLSCLIALLNAVLAEGILQFFSEYRTSRIVLLRIIGFSCFLLAVASTYSLVRYYTPVPSHGSLRVLLVQHNDNPWLTGRIDETLLTAQRLSRDGLKHGNPDVVVWSETIVPYLLTDDNLSLFMRRRPSGSSMGAFLDELGTFLLMGAPYKPEGMVDHYNAALLFSRSGRLVSYYAKQHLIPLAETVPFWDFPPFRRFFGEYLGLTEGWGKGRDTTVMELPLVNGTHLRIGTPICFEDSLPYICRKFIKNGADLLINLTNVSWSGRESAEIQMLVAARFRSIENKRVLIRATNSGVTSVIDPKGKILSQLDLFTEDALFHDVPVYREERWTPYTQWGDYFPPILAFLLIGALIYRRIRDFRLG